MPTISEIRQKYPQYDDMSDSDLAGALHRKFYSDMPRDEFDAKIGLASAPTQAAPATLLGQSIDSVGRTLLGPNSDPQAVLQTAEGYVAGVAPGIAGMLPSLPGQQTEEPQIPIARPVQSQQAPQQQAPTSVVQPVQPEAAPPEKPVPVAIKVWERTRPDSVSAGEAFGRAALSRYVNNFMALPSLAVDALKVNPLQDLQNLATNTPPEPVLGSTPRVTVNDVLAAKDTAVGAPTQALSGNFDIPGQFSQNQQEREQAYQQMSEDHPIATTAGEVTGDIATLLTGRAPLAQAGAKTAGAAGKKAAQEAAEAAVKAADPGVRKIVSKTLNSSGVRKLKRGLGRAAETGLEGATISALNGGDPVETAAWAAGGQLGGSLALTVMPKSWKGATKFGLFALGATASVRLMQDLLPGGSTGNWGEATDEVFNALKYGLIAGSAAAISGAGRIKSGALAENLPMLADAITTIPRGALVSMWSEVSRPSEDSARIMPVVDDMAANPQSYTPRQRDRIMSAIKSEKRSIGDTIREMMVGSTKFRDQVDRVMAPAAMGVRG